MNRIGEVDGMVGEEEGIEEDGENGRYGEEEWTWEDEKGQESGWGK